MLLRFRFSNFRSFRSEEEFSLIAARLSDLPNLVRRSGGFRDGILPAAAIYGANASGKTNVIQAFRFLVAAVSASYRAWKPDGPIPRQPFAADPASAKQPSEMEVDFLIRDVRYRYGFRIDSEEVLGEWLFVYPNGKRQTWFRRERGRPISFSNKMPGENRTIESLTRKNSLFLSAAAQNNHEALLAVYRYLSEFLFVIGDRSVYSRHTADLCSRADYRTKIAQLIAIADLGIGNIEVAETTRKPEMKQLFEAIKTIFQVEVSEEMPHTDKELRLLHRFGNNAVPFPPQQESDGTIAYLALLGPMVDALSKGVPLFIDELDASLHPLLAIELIRLFNNPTSNPNGAQVVFNTRDTNLLNAGILRRDQIWFTEKSSDGISHLFPLSDFRLRRQENLESGYLQGRYGAIPFLNADSFVMQFEPNDVTSGQAR